MIIKNGLIFPDWLEKYKNKLTCAFTTPYFGNMSHTRQSIVSGKTTYHNKIALLKDLKIETFSFFSPLQIHSDIVLYNIEETRGLYDKSDTVEGDACVVDKPKIALLTTWADCVPVILYEFNSNITASIHSGWKSTYKQIVNKTIDTIIQLGGSPVNIKAAIGPSVRKCCYEVGKEFYEYFNEYPDCFEERNGMIYFDPAMVVYKQLIVSGVLPSNIEFSNMCTCCSKNPEFFSYRRDPVTFEGQGTITALL